MAILNHGYLKTRIIDHLNDDGWTGIRAMWIPIRSILVDVEGSVYLDPYAEARNHRNTYEAPIQLQIQRPVGGTDRFLIDIRNSGMRWERRPISGDVVAVHEVLQ